MRIVMVHCTSDRIAPVVFWKDGTNSVHTYCGLEIVIMTMKPSSSCIQRALAAVPAIPGEIVVPIACVIAHPFPCEHAAGRPKAPKVPAAMLCWLGHRNLRTSGILAL